MPEFEDSVRAAFEAEIAGNEPAPDLRERVIHKAVASERAVVPLRATVRDPRRNPWVQWGALAAAVALVAVAGGLYARSAFTGSSTAVHTTPSATLFGPMEAFGKLPAPTLHRGQVGFGGGGPPSLESSGPPSYYGPASLRWAGKLPSLPANAPVYRYLASDPAAEQELATRLGATPAQLPPAEVAGIVGMPINGLREYRGSGRYDLIFGLTTVPANPSEPTGIPIFTMAYSPSASPLPTRQGPMTDGAAKAAAASFLAQYGLTPAWPYRISVAPYFSDGLQEPVYAVQYQRLIDLGGGVKAGLVDSLAQPLGLRVDVAAGTVFQLSGLPPISEQPATYPLEPGTSAVQSALTAPPLDSSGPTPKPAVVLKTMLIAYSGVVSGPYAYLEPAYLFSGLFGPAGAQQQKVVLVPALAHRDTQS